MAPNPDSASCRQRQAVDFDSTLNTPAMSGRMKNTLVRWWARPRPHAKPQAKKDLDSPRVAEPCSKRAIMLAVTRAAPQYQATCQVYTSACVAAVSQMGLIPPYVRLPMTNFNEQYHDEMRAALATAGVLLEDAA